MQLSRLSRLPALLVLALLALGLAACSDSPAKIHKDQISAMEEVTQILEKVADGSLSSADAAAKIGELDTKFDKLKARAEKLGLEKMKEKPEKEMQEKMGKAVRDMMGAMVKVQTSGRGTKELTDAITNMGTTEP
jgi:TolA-binding protein